MKPILRTKNLIDCRIQEFFMKLPIACIKKIIQIEAVEKIWLYGSRARKDNSSRSDFDLAISCPAITEKDWQQVLLYVEEADTLLPIDCVCIEKIKNQELLIISRFFKPLRRCNKSF